MKKFHWASLFILTAIFIKTPSRAQSVFQKTYAGQHMVGYSIQPDSTGFVIAGTTSASGQGGLDVLILKTDLNGNLLWAKTVGGKKNEFARYIKKHPTEGASL